MKKMKLFTVAFIASLFITSCTKDEANDQESVTIEGKWEMTQYGTTTKGVEKLGPWENDCPSKKDNIQFLNGGVYKEVSHDGCEAIAMFETNGNWTLNDKSLVVSKSNEFSPGSTLEILELTATTLKIKVTPREIKAIASPVVVTPVVATPVGATPVGATVVTVGPKDTTPVPVVTGPKTEVTTPVTTSPVTASPTQSTSTEFAHIFVFTKNK